MLYLMRSSNHSSQSNKTQITRVGKYPFQRNMS